MWQIKRMFHMTSETRRSSNCVRYVNEVGFIRRQSMLRRIYIYTYCIYIYMRYTYIQKRGCRCIYPGRLGYCSVRYRAVLRHAIRNGNVSARVVLGHRRALQVHCPKQCTILTLHTLLCQSCGLEPDRRFL